MCIRLQTKFSNQGIGFLHPGFEFDTKRIENHLKDIQLLSVSGDSPPTSPTCTPSTQMLTPAPKYHFLDHHD